MRSFSFKVSHTVPLSHIPQKWDTCTQTPMNKGIEVSHTWDSSPYFRESGTEKSPYFVDYEVESIMILYSVGLK